MVVTELSKRFGDNQALDRVSLTVTPGEVHAVAGSNGSGKSTLVKVITGLYRPDGGTVAIGATTRAAWASPAEARAAGIAVVHQEAPLIDSLSIAECVAHFTGFPMTRYGRVRWSSLNSDVGSILDRAGISADPTTLCGELRPSEQAMISLVLALGREGNKLLVLDEATAAIPDQEASAFLERVRRLADAESLAVIMVTHRIGEIMSYADRVTVLAAGRAVHTSSAREVTEEQIVDIMLRGSKLSADAPSDAEPVAATSSANPPALELRGVCGRTVRGVDLSVRHGEVLGIAGLSDSGVTELPLLLGGVEPIARGDALVDGSLMPKPYTPVDAFSGGISLLPRDRARNGGVMSLSVGENIILQQLDRFWHRRSARRHAIASVIERFDIRPPDPSTLLGNLSGGNQQKVILGKCLLAQPKVLVLDDPTYGVDPGARQTIFRVLAEEARHGLSVVLLSTEPEQLAAHCDRVVVLRQGRVGAELTGSDLSVASIARWCAA